jgi:4'-phosphopantetheinyl transferase
LVACAVGRNVELGIDAQVINDGYDVLGAVEAVFSKRELEDLEVVSESRAERIAPFIDVWTLKEACLKAMGAGLSRPLNELTFTFAENSELNLFIGGQCSRDYQFALFAPSERHRIAIAVAAQPRKWQNLSISFNARGIGALKCASANVECYEHPVCELFELSCASWQRTV